MKRNTAKTKLASHKATHDSAPKVHTVAVANYPYQPQPNTYVTTKGGEQTKLEPRNFFAE